MRHRVKTKNFGRTPKQRQKLFRNLITELVMHERITTTFAKARYMMPLAERVINVGKKGFPTAYKPLQKIFYDKEAISKVVNELAPRFRDNNGGYIRVKKTHKRSLDKAQMATIEYMGNYIEIYEDNDYQKRKEASGTPTFWDWEQKILEQEREFILNKLDEYNDALDQAEPQQIESSEESQDEEIEKEKDDNEQTEVKAAPKGTIAHPLIHFP